MPLVKCSSNSKLKGFQLNIFGIDFNQHLGLAKPHLHMLPLPHTIAETFAALTTYSCDYFWLPYHFKRYVEEYDERLVLQVSRTPASTIAKMLLCAVPFSMWFVPIKNAHPNDCDFLCVFMVCVCFWLISFWKRPIFFSRQVSQQHYYLMITSGLLFTASTRTPL